MQTERRGVERIHFGLDATRVPQRNISAGVYAYTTSIRTSFPVPTARPSSGREPQRAPSDRSGEMAKLKAA